MKEEPTPVDSQAVLDELRTINRVMDRICKAREINHIMTIILQELLASTGAAQGVVSLVSKEDDNEPTTIVRSGEESPEAVPYRVNTLVTGWVLREKTVLKVDDLDSDDRFHGMTSEGGRFKSIICCPMIVRGDLIGLTSLIRTESQGPFTSAHARLAGVVSSQSAQILGNAILRDQLAQSNELLKVAQKKLRDENVRLRAALDLSTGFEQILGESGVMKEVLAMASRASTTDAPVLVLGETGTGKELLARAIHFSSARREKPFVVKNCGVKTESLLESELFGHVKGAFTGADREKPGLFKEADGGTIFLDEIGDAPASTQAAILRVLENGEIRPIGSNTTQHVDVRVISATNKNLEEAIESDEFRRDLYYRLNTFTITIPSLRDRGSDIPLLIQRFLHRLRTKLANEQLAISEAALTRLSHYNWPGNVRQLQHELERAAILSDPTGTIDEQHLSPEIRNGPGSASKQPIGSLRASVEHLEIELITRALDETDGNIMQSAKVLGLTRKGLKDKISRYGLSSRDSD